MLLRSMVELIRFFLFFGTIFPLFLCKFSCFCKFEYFILVLSFFMCLILNFRDLVARLCVGMSHSMSGPESQTGYSKTRKNIKNQKRNNV